MSKLIWIIGAAAIAIGTPAVAQGQGKGKGAAKSSHGSMVKGKGQARRDGQVQTKVRARTDARANTRVRAGAYVDGRLDRNRNGIADHRERFIDRDRNGIDDRTGNRFAGGACPPGLAKKTPACVAPGQAKRMFSEGQRIPSGFNAFSDFDELPLQFRDDIPSQYSSDAYRYIRRDDSIYVVDRRTRIVRDIIDLLR